MGAKMLVFSDLHLDARMCGTPRFNEGRETLREIIEIAVSRSVGYVLFCGDVCDPDAVETLRCITELAHFDAALHELGIERFYLPGNHDVCEDGYGSSTLSPLAWAPNATVIDAPTMIDVEGGVMGFLPFTSLSGNYSPPYEVTEWAQTHGAPPRLIFGHLNIAGAVRGSESHDMPRGRDVFWPLAAIRKFFPDAHLYGGHYHTACEVEGITIIGSTGRFAFGPEEKHEPRVLVIDLETRERESIPLESAKPVRTIQGKAGTGVVDALGGYVRIQVPANLIVPAPSNARGYKIEQHDRQAGPGTPDEIAEAPTAADGFEMAKQLARDYATADAQLKTAIEKLVTTLAEEACSTQSS